MGEGGIWRSMGDIFLSYKNEDRPRAALFMRALEAEGLSVWWDQHIDPGADWRAITTARLMNARCVIVLWTQESAKATGKFVQDEAHRAQQRGVYLPVTLDPVEPPLGFGQHQCIPLLGWRGDRKAPAFRAIVAAARAMIAGEPQPLTRPPPAPTANPLRRRLLLGGGVGLLAVAGAAAGLWLGPPSARCAIGLCPTSPTAIAVLPFRNLSGDATRDYLCEGLSEELRDALSRLGSLRVAARTSSEAFRNSRDDVAAIADKLGVGFILDGSVRASGKTLRISAQLIDVKTGFERWSQNYDRSLDDVIAVQTGIATSVAESLRGQLLGGEAAIVAKAPTMAPAAYDAFLRGRQRYRQGGGEKGSREALALFEAAIAADPNYAEAYAARAAALAHLAGVYDSADRTRDTYDRAISSAQKAVELAPGSAYAQSILGYTLVHARLDFAAARQAYERAFAAAPNDARVLTAYGQFAANIGQSGPGVAALAKAVGLDPLNPDAYRAQALALFAAHDYAASIKAMRRALALSPDVDSAHAIIGHALFLQGDSKAALAEYRLDPKDFESLTGLAIVLKRSGDTAGGEAAFETLLKAHGDSDIYQQAEIRAQWGQTDLAFAALTRAENVGDAGLANLKTDPFLDPIRKDPRFQTLLARLKLT